MAQLQNKHTKVVRNLLLSSVLMFGFGFALVPLYDVFCDITGLNGKVTRIGPAEPMEVDRSRTISLQLMAVNNETMPWQFEPMTAEMDIHPGMTGQTAFLARNPTGNTMIAQAVPSIAPAEAAEYVQKINCFCFERQSLDAGQQREMPLLFVIDPELPDHISKITLSYTLFDITPQLQASHYAEQPLTRRFML